MPAPTGLQIYKTSRSQNALARVCGELVNVAAAVLSEPANTTNHAQRLKYAAAIFANGPDLHAARMMPRLLTLPGAQAQIANLNVDLGMVDEVALGSVVQTGLAAIFDEFAALIN